ncbi:MAG TPA: POTRA domain-containing protein, partial [Steroidobacter sp.]|nr:POTRA domain-containing protein [Steroidobacter sp.]
MQSLPPFKDVTSLRRAVPRTHLLATLCALLTPVIAHSQARPDAGRVLEQVTPEPAAPAPAQVELQLEDRPAISLPDDETFNVSRIRITGATHFSEQELRGCVADSEGKPLGFAALQSLARCVTLFYRERGYLLTRAYLPAQQIEGGVVEIAVLEGRLDQVRIDNSSAAGGWALAPLLHLPKDEPLTAKVLERALLLANDTPGVNLRATLAPGAGVGTSDLLVEVAPGRRVSGSISADTYGNRHTGILRPGVHLDFNNPLQLGDRLSFDALASLEDMYYLRAGYQLPINSQGTRVGAS